MTFFQKFKEYYTQGKLRDSDIDSGKILALLEGLYPENSNGHDTIYIQILKLCNSTVTTAISIVFQYCFKQGVFPDDKK